MDLYVIRHRATGKLMPEMDRGRGYSHWNPGNSNELHKVFAALNSPRLIEGKKKATICARLWASQPNMGRNYRDIDGDIILEIKADNRKLDDIEIVPVILIFAAGITLK